MGFKPGSCDMRYDFPQVLLARFDYAGHAKTERGHGEAVPAKTTDLSRA